MAIEDIAETSPRSLAWSNWSGCAVAVPKQLLAPQDEDQLCSAIRGHAGSLRVCGTGHSFTSLCTTDNTLISLQNMPGDVLGHRKEGTDDIVTLQAGASLNQLSAALNARGLGFKNLGDIDVQSFAGAAMTATHGTGQSFPCLAGEMTGMRMITAAGDVIEASRDTDADLLDAGRVSLGALGIITRAEVAVRPAFKLHRRARVMKLVDVMAQAPAMWDAHRNFEFFVLPFCDHALTLTHDETTGADMQAGSSDDETSLWQLRMLRSATKGLPWLRRKLLNLFVGATKDEEKIGRSYDLLASVRKTVFNEMEYHLPVASALDALAETIHVMERNRPDVFFPIEVRKTAADTGWLSPFEGAPRVSVAVHAYQKDDYDWFFSLVEPILRKHGGRPHWGKLHSLGAGELADLYPRFGDFQMLRAELDPKGWLINPHLAKLFGVDPQ